MPTACPWNNAGDPKIGSPAFWFHTAGAVFMVKKKHHG
jgi:hypothetical protein